MTNVRANVRSNVSSVALGNPFATRHIRAGAISYRFPCGDDVLSFIQRLERVRWVGQIVGPHGSGKTTLLRTLDLHWSDLGRTPMVVSLHNGQRSMPPITWRGVNSATQIVVDGFEQLGILAKLWLYARCRQKRCGLLITTHRSQPCIPVVFRSEASVELALRAGRASDVTHCAIG